MNTLHNTQGIKEKSTEAAEGKRHPKCSNTSVSTEREYKGGTTIQSGVLYYSYKRLS